MPAADAIRALLATPTPPDLGPGPRPGIEPLSTLATRLDAALAAGPRSGNAAATLRALVLLWHDHHEPAHELVQDGATADASYVHGILHRREPDYGNARYWFHRVGRHAAFAILAARAEPLLARDPELKAQLLPRGQWDPFAFIGACAAAETGGPPARQNRLRDLQRLEFEVLLERLHEPA